MELYSRWTPPAEPRSAGSDLVAIQQGGGVRRVGQ